MTLMGAIKAQPEVMLTRAVFEDLVERSGMQVDGYIDGKPQFSETTKTFTVASLRAENAALKNENGKLRDLVAKLRGGKPAKTEDVKVPTANAWGKGKLTSPHLSRRADIAIADELGRAAMAEIDRHVRDTLYAGIDKPPVREGVLIEDPNASEEDNEAVSKIMGWDKPMQYISKFKDWYGLPPGDYIIHPDTYKKLVEG